MKEIVEFAGFQCAVERTKYPNGRDAIVLNDANDGSQVAVATINLPDVLVVPGEVLIKDYSENAGMFAALEKAGIVKATGETVRSGFVEIPKAILQPRRTLDRALSPSRGAVQKPGGLKP